MKVKDIFNHPWVLEHEEEIKLVKNYTYLNKFSNNDGNSTKPGSNASAQSVKEFQKQFKDKDSQIKNNDFSLFDSNNNESIFDRVLSKVHTKGIKKIKESEDEDTHTEKKLSSSNVNNHLNVSNNELIKSYFSNEKSNIFPTESSSVKNFNLLDEISQDLKNFNPTINNIGDRRGSNNNETSKFDKRKNETKRSKTINQVHDNNNYKEGEFTNTNNEFNKEEEETKRDEKKNF